MVDDAQLLRRYVESRSEEAFAELVDRHLGLVYHAAARQLGGDTHAAQDIAQTVFLLLAEKARPLIGHPCLAAWLHATTHFKVTATLRAERRRRAREEAVHTMSEILNDPLSDADWERIRPILDEALLELNERDREAVLLRFFEGQPFAEIGARLSLPEKTAHKRVERALDKLRERLARRGITSSAAALATVLGAQAALAAPSGLAATVTGAALAGPGPAAAFTLIQIMSSTKATVTAAVVAVGLAGGIATHEIIASRNAEAALATIRQENNDLLAKVRAAQLLASQAERERGELEQSLASRRAAQAAAANQPSQIPVRTGRPGLQDGAEFLKTHPEFKQALIASFRSSLTAQYGELYATLGLTLAQIERLQDIEMNATRRGVGAYWMEVGGKLSSYQEHQDQLLELLGEAGLQQYRDYNKAAPARLLVTQLASAVYFTDTPLTADQAEALKQIVRDAPRSSRQQMPGLDRVPWDVVMSKAQSILAPAQFAALQDMHQQVLHFQAQSAATRAIPNE
jgi:RNA polymerase sigma factor (sigma-70 family)